MALPRGSSSRRVTVVVLCGLYTGKAAEMRHGNLVQPRSSVLVVDDDDSNRESMCALFEDLPYALVEASDSTQTLELLRTSPSSLVVVFDILLPSLEEGVRVLTALRDDPRLRRHAVVAVTASPHMLTPLARDLLQELSAPLIVKPFDIDELMTAVQQAVERRTA